MKYNIVFIFLNKKNIQVKLIFKLQYNCETYF